MLRSRPRPDELVSRSIDNSLLSPDPPRQEADNNQVIESRVLVVRQACAAAVRRAAALLFGW
jgi:hypothetical protein